MRWYLPDRWPVFWNEIRRMLYGLRRGRLLGEKGSIVVQAIVGAGIVLGLAMAFIGFLTSDMRQYSSELFYTLIWLQLVCVLMLGPALTASAFANEHERGSLEFLLLTPLRTSILVRQKFAGRAIFLLIILVLGLPFTLIALCDRTVSGWEWLLWNALLIVAMGFHLLLGLATGSLFTTTRMALMAAYGFAITLAFALVTLLPLAIEMSRSDPYGVTDPLPDFMRSFLYTGIPMALYLLLSAVGLVVAEIKIGKMRCSTHNERPQPAMARG